MMSHLQEEEEDDSTDEENTKENTAKIDINAWRKRRSIVNANHPLLRRRLSQGKKMCVNYNSIELKKKRTIGYQSSHSFFYL